MAFLSQLEGKGHASVYFHHQINACSMTIFSKLIAGDIPAYTIAESDKFFAFLDIFPCTPGHTLVVPKMETDRLFDLPDDFLAEYLGFCKPIANAIKTAFDADRVNMLTLGFEVPHCHIHLIPMNGMDDFTFLDKIKQTPDELAAAQQKILDAMGK